MCRKKCHFDRSLSQLHRERRSGETRFSIEAGSTGREAGSSTPLRSGRNDGFFESATNARGHVPPLCCAPVGMTPPRDGRRTRWRTRTKVCHQICFSLYVNCEISQKKCHFDRSLSQLYRERRSGETRFSIEAGSTGREAGSSTLLRSGRNDGFFESAINARGHDTSAALRPEGHLQRSDGLPVGGHTPKECP
jgi:hypothetical protein